MAFPSVRLSQTLASTLGAAVSMPFCYERTIRFHETDAAGVVYFANLLTLCHEAYEASLSANAVDLKGFFSGAADLAVPIAHTKADFFQPLFCGDAIAITLTANLLTESSFEVSYRFTQVSNPLASRPLATAITRHVCISAADRQRMPLPSFLLRWIETLAEPVADASTVGG